MRACVAAVVAALSAAGCADVGPYSCAEQAQCQVDEAGTSTYGFCIHEAGRCAWWESSCPGGLIFDESAGEAAETCVARTCESDVIVSPPSEPACSATTRACAEACETDCGDDDDCADGCWSDCIAGDEDPDGCDNCVTDAYLACANQRGCQPEWDGVECCFDQCDDPESPVCDSACAEAAEDHDSCAAEHDAECGAAALDGCFLAT